MSDKSDIVDAMDARMLVLIGDPYLAQQDAIRGGLLDAVAEGILLAPGGGGGASLSDDTPAAIGTSPAAGVSAEASRSDHAHDASAVFAYVVSTVTVAIATIESDIAAGSVPVAWTGITGTPTTLSGYGITDAQPLDADLTAIAALTTTSYGRAFLTLANQAALLSLLPTGDAVTPGILLLGASGGAQAYDAGLASLTAADATAGLPYVTAANTWATATPGDLAVSGGAWQVTKARGLRETSGPTTLSMGAVADGQVLQRSGSTIVGVFIAAVLTVDVGDVFVFAGDSTPTVDLA